MLSEIFIVNQMCMLHFFCSLLIAPYYLNESQCYSLNSKDSTAFFFLLSNQATFKSTIFLPFENLFFFFSNFAEFMCYPIQLDKIDLCVFFLFLISLDFKSHFKNEHMIGAR